MITLKNLRIGYQQTVADNLNVTFPTQKITALLGANGCGKTTLLKTMLGLIKPLHGEILIKNTPHFNWTAAQLARTIGYVPQAQQGVFSFTVLDVVLMGRTAYLAWYATPNQQDKQIAQQSLEQLGVAHLADKSYMTLSGGERQLVLIARALAQRPQCLIMDEPTSNLDFGNQIRVLEHIQQLRQQGLTVIFTTHQPEQAFRYADNLLLMYQGEIIKQGTPKEVMDLVLLAQIYGLSPQVLAKNLHLLKDE
ncbi:MULTISPECIES: ABC transporter ATP-binding protein [unclassified Lonepinella]|uniref:ABC transporter ATP-binding protein n=1 Tax=unclassified Lonepinella TaxID=2642006 RepID=UPI0036D8FA5F